MKGDGLWWSVVVPRQMVAEGWSIYDCKKWKWGIVNQFDGTTDHNLGELTSSDIHTKAIVPSVVWMENSGNGDETAIQYDFSDLTDGT
ncbi:hypothetical protein NHX12_002015 [Muraenolepis orangiensis]|uniref:Uncharacterized protein n=1 Tax=Muraenolepis orangiensis TaxID=630683 RepID=A0A9Q0DZM6_9TELE|nr:hypothetical protein NHX12_002015 [Muraenolepis orangiensis]